MPLTPVPLKDLVADQFFLVADPSGIHAQLYRLNKDGSSTRYILKDGRVVKGESKRLSSNEKVIPVQLEG